MTRAFFTSLIFVVPLIFAASEVKAQNRIAAQDGNDSQTTQPAKRPNLLRELDLSPEQIRQVRRINQERNPVMQESQRRLKAANDALDAAVYADSNNDAEVQARLKDVHAAQLEVLRNRITTEQNVRRVLNPGQLGRFRELRRQFKQTKNQPENAVENQIGNPNRNMTPRRQMRLKRLENRQLKRQNQ